ncbi:MAG: PIN domain-containing protein [Anaerolineales bacterium]
MNQIRPPKPRVFVDADVIFAGAASPSEHSASLVILRLAEITLIEAITSQQAITEAERNLKQKLPQTLPTFRLLVDRCLQVVANPQPAEADAKDLPILIAAVQEACPWLVTFNIRHFQPGHPEVTVLKPSDFILHLRERLTML